MAMFVYCVNQSNKQSTRRLCWCVAGLFQLRVLVYVHLLTSLCTMCALRIHVSIRVGHADETRRRLCVAGNIHGETFISRVVRNVDNKVVSLGLDESVGRDMTCAAQRVHCILGVREHSVWLARPSTRNSLCPSLCERMTVLRLSNAV